VLLPAPLEGEAHGVGVRHIARQRIENGGLQIGGAEAFEQPQQGCGDGAEISRARAPSRTGGWPSVSGMPQASGR
jgi:hypothetical protein